jgi:hypothetical protein
MCRPYSIVIAACLFSVFFLDIFDRWWFEDDPIQFYAVSRIHNPVSLFTDPSVMQNHIGTGTSLVPMQILSYWVDVKLAGFSPRHAYGHSVISFITTALFVYLVFTRFTGNKNAAILVAAFWMMLPSTIGVHYYLATRHYMEGFLFSLITVYLSCSLTETRERKPGLLAAVAVTAGIAMLYKEIFAVVLPVFLLLYGLAKKRASLSILMGSLMAGYAVYRTWMMGFDLHADQPLLGLRDYGVFLLRLPYTFSDNYGGYVLLVLSGVMYLSVCVGGYFRYRRGFLILFPLLMAISIASIYPVSYPVSARYDHPGTWYRVVFLTHSSGLLFGGYLVVCSGQRKLRVVIVAVTALAVLAGAYDTRRLWLKMMDRAELEGRFYIDNPDRLLYSEQAAHWFIPGLDKMHAFEKPHYILKNKEDPQHIRWMLDMYDGIWRYENGDYREDPELYAHLNEKYPVYQILRGRWPRETRNQRVEIRRHGAHSGHW